MIFFIIFLVIPLVELTIFYEVGASIGLLNTLALCFLTAVAGGYLFRQQGLHKVWQLQKEMEAGRLPVQELFDGVCILVAGALLITPGFATDLFGFSLFLPPFRRFLAKQIAKHKGISVQGGGFGRSPFDRSPYDRDRYDSGPAGEYGQYYSDRTTGTSPLESIDVEVEHLDDKNEHDRQDKNDDKKDT